MVNKITIFVPRSKSLKQLQKKTKMKVTIFSLKINFTIAFLRLIIIHKVETNLIIQQKHIFVLN